MKTYWMGSTPSTCDTCGHQIHAAFIDGATKQGPWAIMCPSCWAQGPGIGGALGPGRGQKYRQQEDGSWLQVKD